MPTISAPIRCSCIKLTGLAFVLALGMMALTALIFLRAGRARALAIGIIAGNRNIGLMMAATGFAVPDLAWLYFGLAQFPIYLLPHLLKPLRNAAPAEELKFTTKDDSVELADATSWACSWISCWTRRELL